MSKLKLLSLLTEDIVEQYWGLAWEPYMSDKEKEFAKELWKDKPWPKSVSQINVDSKYLEEPSSRRGSKFNEHRGYKNGVAVIHKGIDYRVGVGTLIVLLKPGKVLRAGMDIQPAGWGALIEISHDDGTMTRYAHLSKINVSSGDEVSAGTIIGETGGAEGSPGAGNSQGPHLHFEYLSGGSYQDPAANNNDNNTYRFLEKSNKDKFEDEKSTFTSSNYEESQNSEQQNDFINLAKSHIGKKYRWGSDGPLDFDCSGFVRYVFNEFGYDTKSVPRTSNGMSDDSRKIEKEDLDVGDLVFFDADNPKGIVDHVGIVISPKGSDKVQMIHAEGSRGVNIMSDLFGNKFYNKIIYGYGRYPIFKKNSV